MSCHWMRRALLALASAAALLVAACGSGTIESQLQPSRIVVFGDGFSDLGQAGAALHGQRWQRQYLGASSSPRALAWP